MLPPRLAVTANAGMPAGLSAAILSNISPISNNLQVKFPTWVASCGIDRYNQDIDANI